MDEAAAEEPIPVPTKDKAEKEQVGKKKKKTKSQSDSEPPILEPQIEVITGLWLKVVLMHSFCILPTNECHRNKNKFIKVAENTCQVLHCALMKQYCKS